MSATIADSHGLEHRPNCNLPPMTIKPSTLAGWRLARCPECGAQRLTRRTTITGTSRTNR